MKEAMKRFWVDWGGDRYDGKQGYDVMLEDFAITEETVKEEEILFAVYTYEDYMGDAFVIFHRDDRLYEVHGGHCSCYGLEDQWEPEETTWAAIAVRPERYVYAMPVEAKEALDELIHSHLN